MKDRSRNGLRDRLGSYYRADKLKVWLCIAAFIISAGYSFTYRIEPSIDARRYNQVATNLVTKGVFCETCDVPLSKDTAIHGVGPGYQLFLAGVYSVFGIRIWMIWMLQALMHATVVFWIYGLIKRFVPKILPWQHALAVGVYAFNPDMIQQTAMLMTETLFVFLLVGSFRLVVSLVDGEFQRYAPWVAALSGLSIGALTLTRPTGLPFLLGSLALLGWKKRWKEIVLTLALFVAIETPWTIRNLQVYDKFILNSVVGGLDFWVGLDPYSPGEFNMDRLPHIYNKIKDLDADELERVSLAETKNIIVNMPGHAVTRTLSKAFKLFALTKTSGFWFHYKSGLDQGATVILSILFSFVALTMLFGNAFDVFMRRKVRHWGIGFALLVVVLMAVSPILTVVVNRYRIPMLPFMALIGADWLANVGGRERRYSIMFAWSLLFVSTGVDLYGAWPKITERFNSLLNR